MREARLPKTATPRAVHLRHMQLAGKALAAVGLASFVVDIPTVFSNAPSSASAVAFVVSGIVAFVGCGIGGEAACAAVSLNEEASTVKQPPQLRLDI